MSFDIFVQGFRAGKGLDVDADLIERRLTPHIVNRDDRFGYARLGFADGGADLYGMDDLASGFLLNHVSTTAVWDVILDLAREASLAIMPVGCPTVVATPEMLTHLPVELAPDAVVLRTGAEVLRLITTS